MQAVILAAGMGKRLGEYTRDNTKCMVRVNGVRLIDRVLTQLSRLKLDRVIIVVGYKGEALKACIGHRYDDKLHIEFVNNPIYDKTNNIYSLSLVKDCLCEDDTLLLESDLIFEDSLLRQILANPYPNLALVAKWETWMDGTVVRLDQDRNIINFISKKAFNYADADLYYKTVNIYKFSKEFSRHKYVPFLTAYCEAVGNNEYYEQVLRIITFLDKSDIKALPIADEKWYEIDDVADLDCASSIFKDSVGQVQDYARRAGGYWRFPSILDFSLPTHPYFPPERMMEEMRANYNVLLRDYPSRVHVNCVLGGKCFVIRSQYVVVGCGLPQMIDSLLRHIEGKVGIIVPNMASYGKQIPENRLIPYQAKGKDFKYGVDELMAFYKDKGISLLILSSPDQVSGQTIALQDVLRLYEWCENRHIRLVVDETLVDLAVDLTTDTLLRDRLLENRKMLIVLRDIAESHGVPGLRLAMMATSDEDIMALMRQDAEMWPINSFAEFYMQIFNKYDFLYSRAREQFQKTREHLIDLLSTVSWLRVIPGEANFLLCEVKDLYTSAGVVSQLLQEYSILVRDCSSDLSGQGCQYIRIAVRSLADDERLISALLHFHP